MLIRFCGVGRGTGRRVSVIKIFQFFCIVKGQRIGWLISELCYDNSLSLCVNLSAFFICFYLIQISTNELMEESDDFGG